jgi:hypothetical protein
MARRQSQSYLARRRRAAQARLRLASVTVLRGFVSRRSWIQDVNRTFDRMHRENYQTTFADALRAYADWLDGGMAPADV